MSAPVYILGGYQSDFAKSWARQGQDISDMVQEATQGVLANAGLDTSAIESMPVLLRHWVCWRPWPKSKRADTTACW